MRNTLRTLLKRFGVLAPHAPEVEHLHDPAEPTGAAHCERPQVRAVHGLPPEGVNESWGGPAFP